MKRSEEKFAKSPSRGLFRLFGVVRGFDFFPYYIIKKEKSKAQRPLEFQKNKLTLLKSPFEIFCRVIDRRVVFCYTTLNANFGVKLFQAYKEEVKNMFQMHGFSATLSQVLQKDYRHNETPQISEPESKWKGIIFIAGAILLLTVCIAVPLLL